MRNSRSWRFAVALAAVASLWFGYSADARADAVTDWNGIALGASSTAAENGIRRTRTMAIVHIAIHDALNSIDRRSEAYAVCRPTPDAMPEAAVASAAFHALVALLPTRQESLEEDFADALAGLPDGPAKNLGVALGAAVAAHLLMVRAGDGSDAMVSFPGSTIPGQWRPTPPAFAPALLPHWGYVKPFGIRSGSQFRSEGPPGLWSRAYTRDFNEVKSLGPLNSTSRTADQTQIALFWVEPSANGWNRIARTVAESQPLDLWDTARLFALINVAMADAYIANFETKYHFNFWRPVTAIREADRDGNPWTVADPGWTPLVATPPIPDYPSAHAAVGAAAARTMILFFRSDRIPFRVASPTAGDAARSYSGFWQAAEENALSRIYVGFHFRTAARHGLNQGRAVGQFVSRHLLRPIR